MRGAGRRFRGLKVVIVLCGALAAGCGGGGGGGGNDAGGPAAAGPGPDYGTPAAVDDSSQIELKNAASGLVLGITGQSQAAGASLAPEGDSGSADALWHFIPMGKGQYNIESLLSHQVMGVADASTAAGAQVLQWPDSGTADHLWQPYLLSDGNYLIRNVNSGLYLQADSSGVAQSARTASQACSCQEWTLIATHVSPYPAPLAVKVTYAAPDSPQIGIHDPSMVGIGGAYYLYSTHGAIHAHLSTDGTDFGDDGFALAETPAWTNAYTASSGDLWAPDVSEHHGAYWLYYAASTFGNTDSAIGLAVSSTGEPGTFVDSGGPIYASSDCAGANAIDPASVVDSSGQAWLVFGSYSKGIYIVPVDAATGIPAAGAACTQLADHPSGSGIEGAYIYPQGGYYYLFASIDACCQGDDSTYRVIVGRSASVTGPYSDRGGVALTDGGGTILLSAHGNVNGPGGESVLVDSVNGAPTPTLVYHYYDGNDDGDPALGMNRIGFDADGWPYLE